MRIRQVQAISQKTTLSPNMYQALECLQLPSIELQSYIRDAALSNPLIEFDSRFSFEISLEQEYQRLPAEDSFWYGNGNPDSDNRAVSALELYSKEQTFTEYLHEQIGQMRLIDDSFRVICDYIVDCLDERGYLDCSLESIAADLGSELSMIEQGLYAVQMLDPPGVGARNLAECLMLQLVQSRHFDALTVRIIRDGLELLANGDYRTLAVITNTDTKAIECAAKIIKSLNPTPSHGFYDGSDVFFSVPEAEIIVNGKELSIVMNTQILDRISISSEYLRMLENNQDPVVNDYLTQKLSEANKLIDGLKLRNHTLLMILSTLIHVQHDYFFGGILRPLTMQQMAEALDLSTSTVSRAVRNKSIQVGKQIVPLRFFFSTPLRNNPDCTVTPQMVKQQLLTFLKNERDTAPLSDEALRLALVGVGFNISRRTVAKYRSELGFGTAAQRRKKNLETTPEK